MICAGPDCERTLTGEGRVRRRFCSQACLSAYNRRGEDEPTPLPPRACRCDQPIHVLEDEEIRCLRCGHAPESAIARRAA